MVGEGAAVLVERVIAASGIVIDPAAALARYLEIYDGRLLRNTRPYPGIPEFLRDAATLVPLGVVTNKPVRAAVPVIEGLGLAGFFRRNRRWRRPASEEAQSGEPARDDCGGRGVRRAHALCIGDSAVDLRTARNAGTRFCHARYGFGSHQFPEDEIGPADWVVDSAFELPQVLHGVRHCRYTGDRGRTRAAPPRARAAPVSQGNGTPGSSRHLKWWSTRC